MRFLLDAHVSGRVVGAALRQDGHDVRAIDEDPHLEGLADREVLSLAVAADRILVTANVRDFLPLLTELGQGARAHPGCVLVSRSIRTEHFGALVTGLRSLVDEVPDGMWTDRVVRLRRA